MEAPAGTGESFSEGEIIFVDPKVPAEPGHFVVVKLPEEQEPIFRKLIVEDGKPFLLALNPAWPNRVTPLPEGAQLCGVVIFAGRRFV